MMKRRIIAVLTVCIMALCGIAFAACSDSDKTTKYTVEFHANGGAFEGGVTTYFEKVDKDGYAIGKTPTHSNAELSFRGWGLSDDATTTVTLSAYPITKNTHFYAVWGNGGETPAKHTVTFYYNYQGAANPVYKTDLVNDGSAVAEPATTPLRDGYTFGGWYTAAEGGSEYVFTNNVTGKLDLYAHWTEVIVGEPKIISIEVYQTPTKTEYVKDQTFNSEGLIVRALYSGGKKPETLDKTDYSLSKPDMTKIGEQTVTVSYDNDGTTLTADFKIKVEEIKVTAVKIGGILENSKQEVLAVFDPEGLTFTAEYNNGDTKPLEAEDIVFTSTLLDKDGAFTQAGEAQITATYDGVAASKKIIVTVVVPAETKYDVEFLKNNATYANNITGMPAKQRVVKDATAQQPTDPQLKGFEFKGWYTEAACETKFAFTSAINDNVKLYAKWEAIAYTVDYKLNGGDNNRSNRLVYTTNIDGEFESVDLLDPSKGHNSFDGWFFDKEYETSTTALSYSNVTEYAVKDGDTYKVTLYAKFTPEVYNIVYEWGDKNGIDYEAGFVDGYTAPEKYTYGKGATLPDADDITITVLKEGEAVEFNFLGWYIKGDANKAHITAISATLFNNKTVVADIVQSAAYNVTYDYNYAGSSPTVKKVIKDGYASVMSPAPTRTGYTFVDWYSKAKPESSDAAFDFENTKITANTTVYAKWTPVEYTVTYVGLPTGTTNGNSTKYTVEDGENGSVTLNDPTALPEGYRFFGWYSDDKYKTEKTQIVPADIADADENVITVYAKCNNLYTVTFNENVSEGSVTNMPKDIEGVTYGNGIAKPTNPKRDNYTFSGWYVDSACTTAWVFTGGEGTATPVKPTADNDYKCEIFAKWTENADSGVYVVGTVGGKTVKMSDADIADYKMTAVKDGETVTGYTMEGLTLNSGDRIRIMEYDKKTGTLVGDVVDCESTALPVNAFQTYRLEDGAFLVEAWAESRGIDATALKTFLWDIELELDLENPKLSTLYFRMQRDGLAVDAERKPDGTETEYELAAPQANTTYIYGSMTGYRLRTNDWSDGASSALDFVKTANGDLVIMGVKLYKYDEIGVHTGDIYAFGGSYGGLGTPVALGSSGTQFLMFTGDTGVYNIVLTKTDNKYTSLTIYAQNALSAEHKSDAPVYVGKTPTAANFTVTYDGTALEEADYIVIADAAADGENTATIVYLDGGVFTTVTYTATADAIKTVEITTKPAALKYYVGDSIDFTDIVLKVIYNSGDELVASWTNNNLLDGNVRITLEISETYYADGGFVLAGEDIPVTVKFDGIAATTDVEISVYNKLTSIVVTAPTTTEYVAGVSEALDYTGLVVTAYYNDTTAESDDAVSAVISLKSEENESGYTIDATAYAYDTVGNYDIAIALTETFGTLTSTVNGKFTVSVVAPKVISVAAADDSALTKTTQLIGSAFDASGLKFVGTKNDKDATEVEIAAADMTFEITVDGETATNEAGLLVKSGTATVIATYTVGEEELTATFDTAVTFEIANKLTSITATQPTKTSFPKNGTFDKTGMTVTAKYNEDIEGATEVTDSIDLDDCTVTANLTTVGETAGVITVSYTENGITETTTVNVEVTEPKVVSVAVTNITQLTKKKYYVGDTFAPAGLKFKATYDNGTIETDIGAAAFTFNGGNAFAIASATANSTVVSIVYTADETVVVTGTVTVTVYNKLTSIVLTTQPEKPHGEYGWVVGDSIESLNEVAVTAYYNNTTAADGENAVSKTVNATTNAPTINMSTVGKKTITATYNEAGISEQMQSAQCTIEIEVSAKAMVALDYEGDVIEQYKNRAFDPEGLEFYKVYNNETREKIVGMTGITFTATDNWLAGGTFKKSGENVPVSANYTEGSENFDVALKNVTVVDNTEYKVSYNGNNGDYAVTVPKADYYQFESTVATPAVPVCYGFTFGGWYTDAACTTAWIFNDNISEGGTASQVLDDTVLYAKWTPEEYTVVYASGLGLTPFVYKVTDNNVFEAQELGTPTTEAGKLFVGWTYTKLTTDPTPEQIFKILTQARLIPDYIGDGNILQLKPVYDKEKYTVTFDSNGGSAVAPQNVEYQGKASEPTTAPTKNYYTFAGWYTTAALDTAFDFANTQIEAATTIYAKWDAIEYDVIYSFKDENGDDIAGAAGDNVAKYNADQGSVALKPATTTVDGKVFIEWQNADGDKVTALSTSLINEDGEIVLTAVFGEATVHTVTFDSNGGSSVTSQPVIDGKQATKPADPTKTHYTFAGWYTTATPAETDEQYNFATPVTAAVTLYAKWTPVKYTVTFDSKGGSDVTAQDVDYNSNASKPTDPTRPNYTFKGWFTDEEPAEGATQFDFDNTPITGAITLYAKWEKNPIKVTVNYNYVGQASYDITVPNSGLIAEPMAPNARAGYRFDGWYETATPAASDLPFDFGTTITTNKTLYAKWTAVNGLYVGTTLLKAFVQDKDGEYAAKYVKIEGTTTTPVNIKFYVGGTAQTEHMTLKASSHKTGFAISGDTLKVTATGIYTIYYTYDGDTNGVYIEHKGDANIYVEPQLKDGDGIYVGNTLVKAFSLNENSLNQVMAQNVEITTASLSATVTVTLKYNGTTATIAYLEKPTSITVTKSGNSLTMYSGTYNFYYNYAKKGEDTGTSHDNAANRLWVEGTQTGIATTPLTKDTYIAGSFNGWSTNSADYKFDNSNGLITVSMLAGDEFKVVYGGAWLGYSCVNSGMSNYFEMVPHSEGATQANIKVKVSGQYRLVFNGTNLTGTRIGGFVESTITFDAQSGKFTGGTATSVTLQTVNGVIAEGRLPTVTRDGFVFGGWYTQTNGKGTLVTEMRFSSNATVYAKWTEEGADPNAGFTYGSIYSSGTTEHKNKAILTGKFTALGLEAFEWKNGYYMEFNAAENSGNGQYELVRIYLQKGDVVKIRLNGSDSKGVYSFISNYTDNVAPGLAHVKDSGDGGIEIKDTGYYSFYFKANWDANGLWLIYSAT